MTKSGRVTATAAMLLNSLIWGASFVSMKVCYQWFSPYAMLKYRLLISAATLALFMICGRHSFRIEKKDLPRIFLCGALGVFLYYLCELVGMQWLSASTASVLIGAIPVASLLATAVVSRARPTLRVALPAVLSTVGILVASGFQSEAVTRSYLFGLALMLCAIVSWVVYGFLSAELMGKYDGVSLTFYQILFGALLAVLIFPGERVALASVSWEMALNMLFLGAVGSGACYLLYNRAVCKLNVTVTNTLMNLVPVFTVLTEIVLYRRFPGPGTAVGGALIVIAAMLTARA